MTSTENDAYKEFGKEHCMKWCRESDLPENFFELSVDERREADYQRWKRWSVTDKGNANIRNIYRK